jgi:septin family protein
MKIYKMNDKSDNFTVKKNHTFNLPMRLLLLGSSGCGKTGNLGNLLLRSDFYRDDFKPENIYIFSGSLQGGGYLKLMTIIETLEIPSSNLFFEFDEESAHAIYDQSVKNYNEAVANKTKPPHVLYVMDDLGFTNKQNKNQKNSILDKIICKQWS